MYTTARWLCLTAVAAVSVALAAEQTAAQELRPGDEVRVKWDEGGWSSYGFRNLRSASFDLVSVEPDRIVGRRGRSTVVIPLSSVVTVERRTGTKPASAPAMVIGSAGGFLAGFVGGMLKASYDPTVNGGREIANSGIVSGVLFGAPAGALIAWVISRQRGIYEPIGVGSLLPTLDMSASGGVGLSFRLGSR